MKSRVSAAVRKYWTSWEVPALGHLPPALWEPRALPFTEP